MRQGQNRGHKAPEAGHKGDTTFTWLSWHVPMPRPRKGVAGPVQAASAALLTCVQPLRDHNLERNTSQTSPREPFLNPDHQNPCEIVKY